MPEWKWDSKVRAWLFGSVQIGCGVHDDSGEWEGMVVCGEQLVGIGPHATKEEVFTEAEETLKRLCEANEYTFPSETT